MAHLCKNCLLYQLFAPYGAVTSVKSMETKTEPKEGKYAGWFGFVNYKDLAAANRQVVPERIAAVLDAAEVGVDVT